MRSNPHLNASLIREARMIAQQFFRSRENTSFWESTRTQPKIPPMLCCFCMDSKKRRRPATEVIQGYSVCAFHAEYAKGPDYSSILQRIQERER